MGRRRANFSTTKVGPRDNKRTKRIFSVVAHKKPRHYSQVLHFIGSHRWWYSLQWIHYGKRQPKLEGYPLRKRRRDPPGMSKCRIFYRFPVSQTHISPVGLGRLPFFRIMHLQKPTVGSDHMVNSLLGLGRHLLFESYMAYTHSIGTKQLSELSLQRVSRLLLVPRLLCARLTGRLACDTLLRVSPSDGPFSGTPDL
jgi:hypothetical protein